MDSSKSSKEKTISVSGHSSTDRDRLDFIKDIILPILRKREDAAPFLKPVDARKRNHRDYYFVITHPMDLGIIRERLKTHFYKTSEECIADFQQIFKNATRYYSKRCVAHRFAKSLEKAWNGMVRAMPKIEIDNRKRVCKPNVKSGADKTGDNNSNKRSSSKAHRGKKKSTKQDDIINVVGESLSFAGHKAAHDHSTIPRRGRNGILSNPISNGVPLADSLLPASTSSSERETGFSKFKRRHAEDNKFGNPSSIKAHSGKKISSRSDLNNVVDKPSSSMKREAAHEALKKSKRSRLEITGPISNGVSTSLKHEAGTSEFKNDSAQDDDIDFDWDFRKNQLYFINKQMEILQIQMGLLQGGLDEGFRREMESLINQQGMLTEAQRGWIHLKLTQEEDLMKQQVKVEF